MCEYAKVLKINTVGSAIVAGSGDIVVSVVTMCIACLCVRLFACSHQRTFFGSNLSVPFLFTVFTAAAKIHTTRSCVLIPMLHAAESSVNGPKFHRKIVIKSMH